MNLASEGADLHVHTTFSDGTDDPSELIAKARGRLQLISICDHDTIAAYDHLSGRAAADAAADADAAPVAILPGVEISARVQDDRCIHLLGYFPDGFTEGFRKFAGRIEADRRQRVLDGVRKVREGGIPLRWGHLEEFLGRGVPCRSHVARALVAMGVGRSPHGIFDRFLGGGRFAPPEVSAADAIAAVRQAGGTTVWAHPPMDRLDRIGRQLVTAGLQGIEAGGRWVRGRRRHLLAEFAADHDLMTTGGSDYHHQTKRFRIGDYRWPLDRVPESWQAGI